MDPIMFRNHQLMARFPLSTCLVSWAHLAETIDPLFSEIKRCLGVRQSLVRGLEKVNWGRALISTSRNLLKQSRLGRRRCAGSGRTCGTTACRYAPALPILQAARTSLPPILHGIQTTSWLRLEMNSSMRLRRKTRKSAIFSIVPTGSDHAKLSGDHAEYPPAFSFNGGGASLQTSPYN